MNPVKVILCKCNLKKMAIPGGGGTVGSGECVVSREMPLYQEMRKYHCWVKLLLSAA